MNNRTIYGGSAYSFSVDHDFKEVGYKEEQWQEVLDTYYKKYNGLKEWHKAIVKEVLETGRLVVPSTGRVYEYTPYNGKYSEPAIKNYPVQGLGADIVALARVSLYNRLKRLRSEDKQWEEVKLVNTVHDSIIADMPEELVVPTAKLIEKVFEDLPSNFRKMFGVEFNLPIRVEQEYGKDWGNMQKVVLN